MLSFKKEENMSTKLTYKHRGRYKENEILDLSDKDAKECKKMLSEGKLASIKLLILSEKECVDLTRNQVLNLTNLREIIWPKANVIGVNLFKRTSLKYATIYDCPIIGAGSFNCSEIEEITLPANLEVIGESAFCGCAKLNKVNMENMKNNISIPESCFYGASKLSKFDFTRVSTIGKEAFAVSGIESIELNSNIEKIDFGAFSESKLKTIKFNAKINFEDGYQFSECANLKEVDFNNMIESIPDNFFWCCCNLDVLKNTESIKHVGQEGFKETCIREINMPNLQIIERYAFASTKIESICLPDMVECVGVGAFAGCRKLKSVIWNEKCQTISDLTFRECTMLESLSHFENVKEIGHRILKRAGSATIIFEQLISLETESFYEFTGVVDLRKTSIFIDADSLNNMQNVLLPYYYDSVKTND